MRYGQKLSRSWSQYWNNRSLLTVLLLEFILGAIIGILFLIADIAVIFYLNKDVASALAFTPDNFNWQVFLNAKTIITMSIIGLMQLFILVYMDSFFKAGFFGMLKNSLQDGSTVIREFLPEAKHYWYAMFRLYLLRAIAYLIIGLPFLIALIQLIGTTPQLVTQSQAIAVGITFTIALLLAILISYWLLYAEAYIVFDDEEAIPAFKSSMKLANSKKGKSIATLLTFIGIIIVGVLIATLVELPFTIIAQSTQSAGWAATHDTVKLLLNIVTLSATVIASVFVFLTYQELSLIPAARRHAATVKPTTTPLKRKR